MRMPGSIGDFHRNGGHALVVDDLPLTSDDVVIDGGGYLGGWASDVLIRYGSRLIVFEPMPEYATHLRRLFGGNSRVEVIQAALSDRSGEDTLSLETDGSTRFPRTGAKTTRIPLVDVSEFLLSRQLEDVGCLALNIEGSEYEVLDRLINTDLVARVRCIVVQFHAINEASQTRRNAIREAFARTHRCNFNYPFVWESWTRIARARTG